METTKEIITEMIKTGLAQVTVLTGSVPEQKNPSHVTISGNIDAPQRFIKKRGKQFDDKKSHAIAYPNKGIIDLYIDETNPHDWYKIVGEIKVGEKFADLGINKGKEYTTGELSQKLRMLRNLFPSRDEHAKIVADLRNINAKIHKAIEKADDLKGNMTNVFEQTVQSNVPDSIKLSLPLIEGFDPVEIEVHILLRVGGSQEIICTMESVDGAEAIENEMKRIMEEEIGFLEGTTTVIIA